MKDEQQELSFWTDTFENKISAAEEIRWEDIEEALSQITEDKNKGLYGLCCYYAAYNLLISGKQSECLPFLNDGIRCMLGTEQEREVARCYNMLGVIAHGQDNLVLALEQYEMALNYADQYEYHIVHSLIVSNMADAYFRVGAYERAIRCYNECIKELEQEGDHSTHGENNFQNIIASFGYCLLMADRVPQAIEAAKKLQKCKEKHETDCKLPVYTFYAFLSFCCNEQEKTEDYVYKAVQEVKAKKQVTSDIDALMNLIHLIIRLKRYDYLQEILDYMEPLAAIERNEGLLLQLLLFHFKYCSDIMSPEDFQNSTQTFFRIKEKYEASENNRVLYMMEMRNKLRKIEEEQQELKRANTKLLYQMDHDSLSGLYCKRCLNQYIEKAFEDAMYRQTALGVLFLDIDFFKEMNDTYGHQEGDKCIVAVADCIKKCMPDDFWARYGGDEFVVVMKERSDEYVEKCAADLVAHIRELRTPHKSSRTDSVLTITVGAVNAIPHKPNKVWDYLSSADELLYEQKMEQKGKYRFENKLGENV